MKFKNILQSKSMLPISKNINVTIILTHMCNFNCWYCYDTPNRENKENKNIFLEKDIIKDFLNNYKKQLNTSLSINIIGGEPTLHPNFIEIIEVVNSYDFVKRVTITTNGSANKELYCEAFNILSNKLVLSVSYHYGNASRVAMYENLFQSLMNKNNNVNISFMVDNKIPFEKLNEVILSLEKYKFNIVAVPLHGVQYNDKYTDLIDLNHISSKRVIKITHTDGTLDYALTNELTKLNFNPFKDMKCDSFKCNWTITFKGYIGADCTLNKNKLMTLRSYNEEDFKIFLKNIPEMRCGLDSCHCWTLHKKYL